jgi:hypothetical protein
MKRVVVSLIEGVALAWMIACGGTKSPDRAMPKPGPNPEGAQSPHSEITRLDQAITDDMAKLNEPREPLSPQDCTTNCATQMSGAAQDAIKPADATCRPAQTATCTEACTLKKSICDNAGRICTIASDLGGNDGFANDKCNTGTKSCNSAKKRCCGCQ